jgi:Cdc6-like AAA superfamily ATPase
MENIIAGSSDSKVDFCQIRGGKCIGDIRPQNLKDNSCFAAYPFDQATMENMEQLKVLLLERIGIELELPHTFFTGTIIFCKLCPYIRHCGITISEITTLNKNVIFEHGFALGVGSRGIFLSKKARRVRLELELLKSVDQCEYLTREDIVARLMSARPPLVGPESKKPTLNVSDYTTNYPAEEGQVYYIKSLKPNDIEETIKRILKKSGLPYIIDDPVEYASHEIYTHITDLCRSQYVLANFISDEWEHHLITNARTAFLLGIALGMGKEILSLQEKPIEKTMIDLSGLVKNYEKETTAREIAESWIDEIADKHKDIIYKAKPFSRRLRQTRKLEEFNFGQPEAEYDEGLFECFTETPYYKRAKRFDKWLFLGRRGVGKTAIYLKLAEEFRARTKYHLCLLEPTELQFLSLKEFTHDEFASVNQEFVFKSIWRYILLTEIAKSLAETPPSSASTDDMAPINKFFEEQRTTLQKDFVDRLKSIINELVRALNRTKKNSDKTEVLSNILLILRLNQFTKDLIKFCQIHPVVMLIDKVDTNWNLIRKESVDLLVGLVKETHRLNQEFGDGLHILLFLRDDIYDILRRFDQDLDKKDRCDIQWEKSELIEFIGRRISLGFSSSPIALDESAWHRTWENIFHPTVKGKPVTDFIIERTLMRPRDVLIYCRKCLELAQNRRRVLITEQDVLDAESEYSLDRLFNIGTEYLINYPGLSDFLLDCFTGSSQNLKEDDLYNKISIYINGDNSKRNWKDIKTWLTQLFENRSILEMLFNIGFIGITQKDGEIAYVYSKEFGQALRNSAVEQIERVKEHKLMGLLPVKRKETVYQKLFVIHPAFTKVLE